MDIVCTVISESYPLFRVPPAVFACAAAAGGGGRVVWGVSFTLWGWGGTDRGKLKPSGSSGAPWLGAAALLWLPRLVVALSLVSSLGVLPWKNWVRYARDLAVLRTASSDVFRRGSFYTLSERNTFQDAFRFLEVCHKKQIDAGARETARMLVHNRLPNLCFTRDRLLFYDLQQAAAAKGGVAAPGIRI